MFAKLFAKKTYQYELEEAPGGIVPPESFFDYDDDLEEELDELMIEEEHKQNETKEKVNQEPFIPQSSIADVLQQRLVVYQKELAKAEVEQNAGKTRRMGRIIKRFQEAIKFVDAGKSICIHDYPSPPDHALIPVPRYMPTLSTLAGLEIHKLAYSLWKRNKEIDTAAMAAIKNEEIPQAIELLRSASAAKKIISKLQATKPICKLLTKQSMEFKTTAFATARTKEERAQAQEYFEKGGSFDKLTDNVQEMEQSTFQESVIAAKKEDIYDKIINDAQSRLKMERSFLVSSPSYQLDENKNDPVIEEEASKPFDLLSNLEQEFTKQLKFLLTLIKNHEFTGFTSDMDFYENLALNVVENMDIIIQAKRTSLIPKYHYGSLKYYMIKCCTDLKPDEFELTIIRGVKLTCSNLQDLNTYVEIHFSSPYRSEPVIKRSRVFRNSNDPEYQETFIFYISDLRQSWFRNQHKVKIYVMTRSGFFRKDGLLGCRFLTLDALQNQYEVYESLDLRDENKVTVGKLEVRMRLQRPMDMLEQRDWFTKEWLLIDN